jgi:hypothetical protein
MSPVAAMTDALLRSIPRRFKRVLGLVCFVMTTVPVIAAWIIAAWIIAAWRRSHVCPSITLIR